MRQSPTLRQPLRIGLLLDSFLQPQWVVRIIDEIAASSIAEIVLVVRNRSGEPDGERVIQRVWQRRNHLFYSAYTKLDDRLSRVTHNAFKRVRVETQVSGVPVLDVEPLMHKFNDRIKDEDIKLIREHNLDVALRFGFRILKGDVLQIAKHGVWSYHHDDGRVYRGGPPGFWEVMTNDPVTGSMLQILNEELDNGQVIYRSWSSTINKFSVKKNNNNYYWKSSAFVMRKLRELYDVGSVSQSEAESNLTSPPYSHRLYKTPTNTEMFRLALGLVKRATARSLEKLVLAETWSLAYRFRINSDRNNTFYKFKFLLPPPGKFWADPFPVRVGEKYFVFFEEFLYDQDKAHISVIELQRGQRPKAPVKVLEQPYHLSYPFVFEWQGSHYMIPETGCNNTVELYRSKRFPFEWELEKVLLEANNPTDATLAEIDGRWWMYVNIEEPGVTVNWEELHLFHADNPLGPWTPHQRNPIKSDVRNSRPAGRLFNIGDSLYRPAQDCSTRYGYATAINEVKRITPDEYFEEEVSRITPDWDRNVIGTHTLNSLDDLTVIDCLVKRNRVLSGRGLSMTSQRAKSQVIHDSKENVLQFIHSFIQGGSERQMIQLTRLLLESGKYNVYVACLHDGGALRHEVTRLGFKTVREFPLNSFYDRNMAAQLRKFSVFLKENDIRLVHTHDFYSNIFGMAGAALGGVPVRIASRRETSGMRTPAQKKAERLAFRLANNIVTNADAVMEQLALEGVARDKISVVYNGLDLDRLTPRGLSRAEVFSLLKMSASFVQGEPKFVTIVANMQHEVKDHSMFLRAARRIQAAIPEARFLLAGEGRLLEQIQAFAHEQGVGDFTFFLGRCEHVPDLLTISDVCVLSSKAEGFSNAILEYMAAGRPVVATDVGGAREALVEGETGYLVASGDDETMAERVISLLREPERMKAMGRRARRIVEDNFSCESQLRRTEELYERYLVKK